MSHIAQTNSSISIGFIVVMVAAAAAVGVAAREQAIRGLFLLVAAWLSTAREKSS